MTATVADGFGWGTITSPWRRVDAETAVWVQTLAAGSCADAVPTGPPVVEAVCTAGVVTAPTLTVTDTDQIDYSVEPDGVDPPFVAGQTVTVTATLAGWWGRVGVG